MSSLLNGGSRARSHDHRRSVPKSIAETASPRQRRRGWRVIAVGGGTKNPLWNQIKADVVGKPLAVLEFQETSSLGAALLGGLGAGLYGSFEETVAVARGANSARVVAPDAARTAQYAELLDVFTALYPATKALAHRLAQPRGET